MKKTEFTFRGFKIEYQPNGKYGLIILVPNDMAASIIYPIISESTNFQVKYNIVNNYYFDLLIVLNDSQRFYELNFDINDDTKRLASIIDQSLLANLWIGYYAASDRKIWGTAIQVHS